MTKFAKAVAGIITSAVITVTAGAGYIYTQREAILQKVAATAADYASESLGLKVEIGDIVIGNIDTKSTSDITVKDVALYDKNSELIAKAEKANVNFKLLSLYSDPLSAIDEIDIYKVEGNVIKRQDGSWNFEDIKTTGEGESTFDANIKVEDAAVNVAFDDNEFTADVDSAVMDFDTTADFSVVIDRSAVKAKIEGNKIDVEELSGELQFDHSNITAEAKAKTLGSNLTAKAAILDNKQIVNVRADKLSIDEIIPFIPEGTIPDGVEVQDGEVDNVVLNILRRDDNLSFSGQADVQNGHVTVEQTEIENISGSTTFNDSEVLLSADLEAAGQKTKVSGSIKLNTDETYFDLNASSDSFDPNAIMYLPAEGVASFTARLTGTASNPIVEADIYSPSITYEQFTASDVSTHMKYQDDTVYLSGLKAELFGGEIEGDLELKAMDLSYNAHLTANSVSAAYLANFMPVFEGVSGLLFADVGINGKGDEIDELKIYGSANASSVHYDNVPINRVDTSFYVNGKNVTIDYASAAMPNGGSVGLEGKIKDGSNLDLKFYGSHIDLTVVENFLPQVEVSGLTDLEGSIKGKTDNPNVALKCSAVDNSKNEGDHFKGVLFDQPYDSLTFSVSGSLDGVEIQSFDMLKGGKEVWLAKGTVGFVGERKLNLQIDTVGARAEDIIRLAAPDQPLTGNVDNIITVTGTLDKPNVVGYIHFWRGSYRGMLVSGMDGDYFIEGNEIRLQDFHVNSPMVDMDLNGTINSVTTDMDFTVEVHDIDVRRFEGKLPENYPASGHGKFTGIIKGNLDNPIFDGTLIAELLTFNGVNITDVDGHISVNGNDILLDNFNFNQGDGSYKVHGQVNYASEVMSGNSAVANVDIGELFALANQKTDLITGKLSSEMQFGGTMSNPSIHIIGTIPQGTFAGSDIHDINLDVNYLNNILYINRLEGRQGEVGALTASGTADRFGPLDIKLMATNFELSMFTKAAGIDAEVVGTANVGMLVSGVADNPEAQAEITASGGVKGSTFDLMRGSFHLKDGIVGVEDFTVQRAIADKMYQVSASGVVPLVSIMTKNPKELTSMEQINLDISLDKADLSLLPVVSDYVAWALGQMQGGLKITGTASNPLINGSISVNDGSTKIKGMSSLIEHMNIKLDFSGERLDITNCSGNIGTGTYNLTGGLNFGGFNLTNYSFNLVADKLGIKSGFFKGPLTAEFSFAEGQGFRGETLPKITGHVDFDNCLVSVPSIPESEGEMPEILMDVAVNLGNKVHFYSPYLYDMHLTGSAHFEGSTTHPHPSGTISVKRGGTVNYLKTVFKIREGEAYFNQPDTFFPTIIFSADTRLTKTRIFLNIDGSLKDRTIRLTSSPEMSETEIIQLLTLRDAYQKGEDTNIEAQDLLAIGLQMSFLSEIEGAVRKTLGFDEFSISRGSGSAFDNKNELRDRREEEYNVSIGKYVTDNLMLRYTRGIGGDNINRYGIQYDINNNMGFTVEREGHDFIFGIEARWKF